MRTEKKLSANVLHAMLYENYVLKDLERFRFY